MPRVKALPEVVTCQCIGRDGFADYPLVPFHDPECKRLDSIRERISAEHRMLVARNGRKLR